MCDYCNTTYYDKSLRYIYVKALEHLGITSLTWKSQKQHLKKKKKKN